MQDLSSRKLIAVGEFVNDLYWMGIVSRQRKVMVTTYAKICHKRLGHPSFDKLSHISLFESFPTCYKDFYCDACNKAEHTRLPFPKMLNQNDCLLRFNSL